MRPTAPTPPQLDVAAFPYDTQTLDYHFTINRPRAGGNITVIPSARGIKLWTSGKGDDANGWHATGLVIYTGREPYPRQYDDPISKNNLAFSHPDDPAPVAPGPGSAVTTPYGDDMEALTITIAIVVKRLSTYFGLNVILPVVTCSLISFVAFHVNPAALDTRLQLTVGLFLALVAIQFVAEGALPRARWEKEGEAAAARAAACADHTTPSLPHSYVIPTRQLVILSYCVLLAVSIESVVVHNVLTRDELCAKRARMRTAHAAHAAHARAQASGGSAMKRLTTMASISLTRPPDDGSVRAWVDAAAAAAVAEEGSHDAKPAGSDLYPGAAKAAAALELERGYNAWRAAAIDRVCFWAILCLYILIGLLIFVIAYIRAPSLCELAEAIGSGDCRERAGRGRAG